MKRLQKVVALVMLIVLIPLASFANEITEEDTSIVRNPDRGFYKLIQVELQQGDEDFTRFEKQIISVENEYPDISIISFQLNLKNYTQKTEINKIKINDIDKYFSIMREHGYKVIVNIIATDLFESRLSCYEREAAMLLASLTPRGCSKETQIRMYDAFVPEIKKLDELGLCDDINVYVRGENINKPPILKYSKEKNSTYHNFNDALVEERAKQRQKLLEDPENYLFRIKSAKNTIANYGVNEQLTQNSLNGLNELQNDFLQELAKNEFQR